MDYGDGPGGAARTGTPWRAAADTLEAWEVAIRREARAATDLEATCERMARHPASTTPPAPLSLPSERTATHPAVDGTPSKRSGRN